MSLKTRRTEIHIETHEIKIIRFGKHGDDEKDISETRAGLLTEPASEFQVADTDEKDEKN